ncbi:hypothetical protein ABZ547_43730, partial [Streptomyces sparsogenes]|uniref:hypothetical protein n=1 Tax=Streptomyces sparsogenes TaxID=67365 RepID=UPI0033FB7EDA
MEPVGKLLVGTAYESTVFAFSEAFDFRIEVGGRSGSDAVLAVHVLLERLEEQVVQDVDVLIGGIVFGLL